MIGIASNILTVWVGVMLICVVATLVVYMLYEILGSVVDWWSRS